MKPIKNDICSKCGASYDPTLGNCPKCGEKGPFSEIAHLYENHSRIGFVRNLILFLVGCFAFQGIGLIVSVIALVYCYSTYDASGGLTLDEYTSQFSNSTGYSMFCNGTTYCLLIIALILICLNTYDELFKSFKKFSNFVNGAVWALIMFGASYVWALISSKISDSTVVNDNQSTLEVLIKAYPLLSILIFGLVGPLCEELSYRVGLYSLTCRVNKKFAIILTSVVFGLIHFDFSAIGTDSIVVELLALPDYIIAGAILCHAYDKNGLAGSFTAHAINNLVSIIYLAIP